VNRRPRNTRELTRLALRPPDDFADAVCAISADERDLEAEARYSLLLDVGGFARQRPTNCQPFAARLAADAAGSALIEQMTSQSRPGGTSEYALTR
jgi:hypothetical protein